MDLPPDKAKVLNSYDDDKKWDMICDQVRNDNFFQFIYSGLLNSPQLIITMMSMMMVVIISISIPP